MEQKFAKGIFLTKRKSKAGKEYIELSIKTEAGYDKYNCFESDKKDKFGNSMFIIYVKNTDKKDSDLPF
jgi:hypothetical protein